MTDLRKAAEMALHALKFSQNMKRCFARAEQDYHEKIAPIAIEALRQALAQPEQEPVAWLEYDDEGYLFLSGKRKGAFPVFIAPPSKQWVGLTDEEVNAIRKEIFEKYKKALFVTRDVTSENDYSAFNFYRAIEEKLRIKND